MQLHNRPGSRLVKLKIRGSILNLKLWQHLQYYVVYRAGGGSLEDLVNQLTLESCRAVFWFYGKCWKRIPIRKNNLVLLSACWEWMIIESEFWLAHLKFLKSSNSLSCFQLSPCSEGEMYVTLEVYQSKIFGDRWSLIFSSKLSMSFV